MCETSTSSIRHSGHTGFLNHLPTVRFGHPSQYRPLHLGHCQAGDLNQPPTSLPHLEQKPRTKQHKMWMRDLTPHVGERFYGGISTQVPYEHACRLPSGCPMTQTSSRQICSFDRRMKPNCGGLTLSRLRTLRGSSVT